MPIDITPRPFAGRRQEKQRNTPIRLADRFVRKTGAAVEAYVRCLLIDLAAAQIYTSLNSTLGMQRAWENSRSASSSCACCATS